MTAAELAPPPVVDVAGRGHLGIVVVNFGPPQLLRRNLATAELPPGEVSVVVVDNWSTAAAREQVTALARAHGWHLVAMPGNPGFGAAVNAGVAAARGLGCRTYLVLNPDAVVDAGVAAALWAQSVGEPLALVCPQLVDSTGQVVFRGSRVDLRGGGTGVRAGADGVAGEWLTAACVVASDELWLRTGGFDEGYFMYWEDVDLSFRVRAAGGTLVVRHDLVAVHDEGGTHNRPRSRAKSPLYYRYNCRNRLLFAARHLDRRGLLRWVARTPAESWAVLLRGGRRQLLRSPRPLVAALRGSLEGLLLALAALLRGPRPADRPVLVVHPGAELYGSDRVLLETVEGLLARGPVVVALPGRGPLADELARRGARVAVVRMPVLRKSVLRPAGALRLLADAVLGLPAALRLLRGSAAVLVNTTVVPSWPLLARLARRPVVVHVHEAEWPGPRSLHRLLLAPLLTARTVVANSEFTRAVVTGLLPRLAERAVVVLNPVPGPARPAAPRCGIAGPVQLLYVGRLSPRKAPDVAVAALRELVDRGVDARLTVVGSVFDGYGWFEQDLRGTVDRLGLADRVTFRGFRADVWPDLAATDVVLVPSVLDESFGNTAVEAVLAARPVVVSDLAGLREATAGYATATVAPPGHPAGWADAVQDLLLGWDAVPAAALTDAALARARHAPQPYRDRLADLVVPPAAGRSVPAPLGEAAA